MTTYILLTERGIREIKNAPRRLEEAAQSIHKTAGKLTSIFTTFGKHDYVAVVEAPNDEVAMSYLLTLSLKGNIRIKTTKLAMNETGKTPEVE